MMGLPRSNTENPSRTQGRYGAVKVNIPRKLMLTYGCFRPQTYTCECAIPSLNRQEQNTETRLSLGKTTLSPQCTRGFAQLIKLTSGYTHNATHPQVCAIVWQTVSSPMAQACKISCGWIACGRNTRKLDSKPINTLPYPARDHENETAPTRNHCATRIGTSMIRHSYIMHHIQCR